MVKIPIPDIGGYNETQGLTHRQRRKSSWLLRVLLVLSVFVLFRVHFTYLGTGQQEIRIPANAEEILNRCQNIGLKPSPPPDFNDRVVSDRFDVGTKPTLIRNATIWTGQANGPEIIKGDIFLNGGIIKGIGRVDEGPLKTLHRNLVIVEVNGAWVTPG